MMVDGEKEQNLCKKTMSYPMEMSGKDEMKAQKGGGGGQGDSTGRLAANDLVYILPPDMSVSVNRTFKNQYFQNNSYGNNQRGICVLNTGADYGDMRQSSLEFDVECTGPTGTVGYFGRHGSAMNLIKSITISSRSGDEVSRVQDLNLLSYSQNGFKYDKSWHETVGQTIGTGAHLLNNLDAGAALYKSQHFSIPLYLLSEFFAYGRLMPPMMLSGMRIEIEWASATEAFQAVDADSRAALAAAPITSFVINNPFVAMRAVQVTDATQRALNEMSAVNGLELVYCDYERTDRTSSGTASDLNMEIRKAASRAIRCHLTTRVTANVNSGVLNSLMSEPWGYTYWQWQLGSLYFPQQPVQSKDGDGAKNLTQAESYKHALITFDKYKSGKCAATPLNKHGNAFTNSNMVNTDDALDLKIISPYRSLALGHTGLAEDYVDGKTGDEDFGTFANGNGIVSVLLERSDLFDLSGVPINNSRVLAVRATYSGAVLRTFTTFLKYVRLARVFMNNIEVEQ